MPAGAVIYYCGPSGFMEAAERCLDALLVPASLRHSEIFGPDLSFGNSIDHPRPRAVSVRDTQPFTSYTGALRQIMTDAATTATI